MTFCKQRACSDVPEGEYDEPKGMHNMIFSNIIVDNSDLDINSAFCLSGTPDYIIEDIIIKDVQFTVSGGGSKELANKKEIPEFSLENLGRGWPEFMRVLGGLPTCGVFGRHIDGLTLENISIKTINKDYRVPFMVSNVKNLSVNNLKANNEKADVVHLK